MDSMSDRSNWSNKCVRNTDRVIATGAVASMHRQRRKILARDHSIDALHGLANAKRVALTAALALLAMITMRSACAGELRYASDLAQEARDAAAQGKVLVVLYGTASCPWCAKVRRNYLAPLTRNADAASRMVITEIDPDVTLPLNDFAGRATNHRSFARAERVRLVPTIVIYGPAGEQLAEPLVGMSSEDFYGAYLEERLAAAAKRIMKDQ
jgi:thioredoxin-related protein